jgi:crotonobetainyl-CoA:carnitine CoA-transferase CaiB-like acyl-CoA transferase
MLEDLIIVDAGMGMSGTLPGKAAADMGARVVRAFEESDDPFHKRYEAFHYWQLKKERPPADESGLEQLLAEADVCIVGGDDFPGSGRPFTAAELSARHPRLVVLDIVGTPPGSAAGDMPAHDLLAQARSGMVWEHFSDRPLFFAVPLPTYGAVIQGLAQVVGALLDRESSGKGKVVTASLLEGSLPWMSSLWLTAEHPDETLSSILPKDMRFPVIQCGDGRWVAYTHGTGGATPAVDRILGITEEERQALPPDLDGPDNYFGDMTLIDAKALNWQAADLAAEFMAAGIPAEVVREPGEAWDHEQLRVNGTMQVDDEGGLFVGLPFRYS